MDASKREAPSRGLEHAGRSQPEKTRRKVASSVDGIVGRRQGIVEEQQGEERGSRRLGIMYFIMISQQNCNLQQAMSHTTPAPQRFTHPTISPTPPLLLYPVARSFSLLSTLSLLPSPSLSPRPFNLPRSDHFSVYLSVYRCQFCPPCFFVFVLCRGIVSLPLTGRVSRSVHRRTPANLRLPPIQKTSFLPTSTSSSSSSSTATSSSTAHRRSLSLSLWPAFSFYSLPTVSLSLSLSLSVVADASTRSFSRNYHPSPHSLLSFSRSRFF